MLAARADEAHRPSRRLVQPGATRPPAISLAAIDALGLDEVWWLVSPGNPLKAEQGHGAVRGAVRLGAQDGAPRADPRQRFERGLGTRYTVDTLAKFERRYPHHRFIWLMGEDTVAQFHQWKGWRKIARSLRLR